MINLRNTRVLTALSTLLLVTSASAQTDTEGSLENRLEFTAKPNQCVALRKGQTCYQRVWLRFKAPATGNYCLHVEGNEEPVQCWNSVAAGKYRYELESSENVKFTLHDSSGRVADAQVTIAWVYKSSSRRRTSWRIF